MDNNLHTIFSATGCPSHQQLREYVEGGLTGEEKHRIEAHLADCGMCSDEAEGLSLMQDPGQLPAIVEELDRKIADNRHPVIRLTPRRILSAAAVIILLVGTVFIFRYTLWKPQDTLISEQKLPKGDSKEKSLLQTEHEEAPPPVEETFQVKKEDKRTGGERPAKTGTTNKVTKTESRAVTSEEILADGPEPVIEEVISAEAPEPSHEPAIAIEDVSAMDAAGRGEVDVIGGITKDSAGEVRYKGDGVTTKAVTRQTGSLYAKRVAGPSDMEQAMTHYQTREYVQASALFKQVLSRDSTNFRAIYHLALCYVELNKVKKAEKELEKILADPSNAYYLEAKNLSEKLGGKRGNQK